MRHRPSGDCVASVSSLMGWPRLDRRLIYVSLLPPGFPGTLALLLRTLLIPDSKENGGSLVRPVDAVLQSHYFFPPNASAQANRTGVIELGFKKQNILNHYAFAEWTNIEAQPIYPYSLYYIIPSVDLEFLVYARATIQQTLLTRIKIQFMYSFAHILFWRPLILLPPPPNPPSTARAVNGPGHLNESKFFRETH